MSVFISKAFNQFASKFAFRILPHCLLLALTMVLLLPSWSLGQTTSTIAGTVQDKQGLTVPGAKVTVKSTQLGIDRTVVTEGDGTYRIAALPPGFYDVTVSKDDFQTESFRGIEVTLNRTLVYDVTLQVGSTNQTVEVSSTAPLLETTTHLRAVQSLHSKSRTCRSMAAIISISSNSSQVWL